MRGTYSKTSIKGGHLGRIPSGPQMRKGPFIEKEPVVIAQNFGLQMRDGWFNCEKK